jgi:hypothetical protein
MVDRRPAETGEGLRRRFRYARIEAAVADATSAILIGGTGVATVLTLTAEGRGMLNPGTWLWVLVSGGLVTAGKIALDIRDMRRAGAVWRKLLIQSFGEDMRGDAEASRQARMAIEFRVRLAEAEAAAPPAARARVAGVLLRLDTWLALIVDLAREVAGLRGEARFQAGLATRARSRLAEIEERMSRVDPAQRARLAETARAIAAQVKSFDTFNAFVDDGALRLEHVVGVFSSAVSQVVLELSRGTATDAGLEATIGAEITRLEQSIALLGRIEAPQLADGIPDPPA